VTVIKVLKTLKRSSSTYFRMANASPRKLHLKLPGIALTCLTGRRADGQTYVLRRDSDVAVQGPQTLEATT